MVFGFIMAAPPFWGRAWLFTVTLESSQIMGNKDIHILFSKQYVTSLFLPIFTTKKQQEYIICNFLSFTKYPFLYVNAAKWHVQLYLILHNVFIVMRLYLECPYVWYAKKGDQRLIVVQQWMMCHNINHSTQQVEVRGMGVCTFILQETL